ncbi:hypothetical protein J8F10_12610 [Gemmata sp. G18]|uniref:Uncharacterized protein n=1 Tax=Gemmata palustris TaxID=2822762 RepID=A0ABS5BQW4_9BACT|nr:hypothetical protein [Gemmata palustris]MBP3956125.1 hypothetical protein [Gemmata palustris]
MVASVEPRVEIDDRIREQPELLDAVAQATDYLRHHLGGVAVPALIRWSVSPGDEARIVLTISDATDSAGPAAARAISAQHLAGDPYRRDVLTLNVFSDLLGERSKKNRARINELVRAIDFDALAEAYTNVLNAQ